MGLVEWKVLDSLCCICNYTHVQHSKLVYRVCEREREHVCVPHIIFY